MGFSLLLVFTDWKVSFPFRDFVCSVFLLGFHARVLPHNLSFLLYNYCLFLIV